MSNTRHNQLGTKIKNAAMWAFAPEVCGGILNEKYHGNKKVFWGVLGIPFDVDQLNQLTPPPKFGFGTIMRAFLGQSHGLSLFGLGMIPVNCLKIVTEFLPHSIKQLGSHLIEKDRVPVFGWLLYGIGSLAWFVGRAITSPASSMPFAAAEANQFGRWYNRNFGDPALDRPDGYFIGPVVVFNIASIAISVAFTAASVAFLVLAPFQIADIAVKAVNAFLALTIAAHVSLFTSRACQRSPSTGENPNAVQQDEQPLLSQQQQQQQQRLPSPSSSSSLQASVSTSASGNRAGQGSSLTTHRRARSYNSFFAVAGEGASNGEVVTSPTINSRPNSNSG